MKNDIAAHGAAELIASIATHGNQLRGLLTDLETFIGNQHERGEGAANAAEAQRLADADPFGWLDQAKRNLQAGLMFAERAVRQPTAF